MTSSFVSSSSSSSSSSSNPNSSNNNNNNNSSNNNDTQKQDRLSFIGSNSSNVSIADIARELGVSVPSKFICPITLEVMSCPVQTKSGLNYEKSAIVEWIRNSSLKTGASSSTVSSTLSSISSSSPRSRSTLFNETTTNIIGTCPLTRQQLSIHDLVPNQSLQDKIIIWIWYKCLPVRMRTIRSSTDDSFPIIGDIVPSSQELVILY